MAGHARSSAASMRAIGFQRPIMAEEKRRKQRQRHFPARAASKLILVAARIDARGVADRGPSELQSLFERAHDLLHRKP